MYHLVNYLDLVKSSNEANIPRHSKLQTLRVDMLPIRKHTILVSLNVTFHFQLYSLKKCTIPSFHSVISVDLFSVLKVIFIFLPTRGVLYC